MIPRTYPSTLSGATRCCVIYVIEPTAQQQKWIDYIPVKDVDVATAQVNVYSNLGAIACDVLDSSTVVGKMAWVDYIPVAVVADADTGAFTTNSNGYIPMVKLAGGGAVLPMNIDVTGAQLRAALNDPTAWGETSVGTAAGLPLTGAPWAVYAGGTRTANTVTGVTNGDSVQTTTVSGGLYRIRATVASRTGSWAFVVEGVGTNLGAIPATGAVDILAVIPSTGLLIYCISAGTVAFDSISVQRVVPGWLLPGLGGIRLNGDCRTSVAMQTEADGTVGYAAHNLLTYSTDPSNSSVSITGGTKGATVTPAGDPFPSIEVTLTNGYIYQAATIVDVATYTASAVIKAGTMNKARVYFTSGGFSTAVYAVVDLAAGTIGSVVPMNNGVPGTATIESLGGGRFRVAVSGRLPGITAGYLVVGVDTSGGTFEFGGAQLSLGPTALAYVPTTTAARYGPAIDWLSGIGSYGIRSESARTNLLTHSTDLSNAAWTKSAAAVTQDGPTSPLGIASSKITASGLGGRAVQTVTATSTSHTFWALLKRENRTVNRLMIYNNTTAAVVGEIEFNLQTGVVEAQTVATGAIAALGTGGWYLCEVRVSSGITVGNSIIGYVYCGTGTIANGDIVYCGHAQLEAGTEASSPILTYGASATRAADTLDVLDSGWMNAAEGTVAMEWVIPNTTGTRTAWHLTDGGSNERMIVQATAGGTTRHLTFIGGSAVVALDIGSAPTGVRVRDAFTYKADRYAASRGGSAPITSAHASVPAAANVLRLGHDQTTSHLGGHIIRARYSRRRASNAQLQAMTV